MTEKKGSNQQRRNNDIKKIYYATMNGARGGCLMNISLIIAFTLQNTHLMSSIKKNKRVLELINGWISIPVGRTNPLPALGWLN